MSAELELSITNIETQHPRYFPGRYLLAEDFTQQHDYLNHRLRYTNKSLHVSGIIEGLEVGIGARNEYVTIAAGAAIDNQGNMIVIKEDKTFNDFNQLSHGFLYVQYSRHEEGMQTQNGNSEEFTRWSEDPIIGFNAETQPESAVLLLAEILINENGFLEITDRRKYSGLSIPCKEGEDITLRYGGRNNLINKAVLTGSLHIKNNLTVGEDQGNGTNEPRPLLEVRGELKLETGVAVNQISADQTMAADSDSIIPTQKAIRTYIDQAIGKEIGGRFVKGMIMLWPVVRSSSRSSDEFLQLPEHWKDCDGRDGRPDLNGVLVCGVCQTENTLEEFYDNMINNLGMNEMEYRSSGEEMVEYLYSWPGRPSDYFPGFPSFGSDGHERDLGERWEGYKLVQRNVPNHMHAGTAEHEVAGFDLDRIDGDVYLDNYHRDNEARVYRWGATQDNHSHVVNVGDPSETESVKDGKSVLGFPRPPLIVLRYIIYWPD